MEKPKVDFEIGEDGRFVVRGRQVGRRCGEVIALSYDELHFIKSSRDIAAATLAHAFGVDESTILRIRRKR